MHELTLCHHIVKQLSQLAEPTHTHIGLTQSPPPSSLRGAAGDVATQENGASTPGLPRGCSQLKARNDEGVLRKSYNITNVCLEIGELAAIDLPSLRYSFPIAARNSIAAHATLDIVTIKGCAHCHVCQQDFHLPALCQACPQCQGYDYTITGGQDLRLVKMTIE